MGNHIYYIIGDIHGEFDRLNRLHALITDYHTCFHPNSEQIFVHLGDYVDRGPDSFGVVEKLIAMEQQRPDRVINIKGNHEQMMLDVIRHGDPHHAWLRYGGVETLDSYGFTGDLNFLPPEHERFFDSLGDYFELENYLFMHAGYDPLLPLDQQTTEMLRWYSLTQGIPGPHISGKTAVVGHTANREGEILDAGHLLCLDTFCYGGGWLTAMELKTRQFWQASPQGELRDG